MVRIDPGRRQKDCVSAKVNTKLSEKPIRQQLVSLKVRSFDVLFLTSSQQAHQHYLN